MHSKSSRLVLQTYSRDTVKHFFLLLIGLKPQPRASPKIMWPHFLVPAGEYAPLMLNCFLAKVPLNMKISSGCDCVSVEVTVRLKFTSARSNVYFLFFHQERQKYFGHISADTF